nr:MAG TPA: hypothetical protein [Caudoviricetes sp.]
MKGEITIAPPRYHNYFYFFLLFYSKNTRVDVIFLLFQ